MGLFDAIGMGGNPFVSWLDQNRQGIVGGFQGLANASPNDPHGLLAGAVNGVVNGSQTDYQRNLAANALALQVQQRNAAADWLAKSGHPELADPVRTGAISGADAFNVLNKQTVVGPGASVVDGQNHVVTPGDTGGFYGGDLKSQAWNTVMKANAPGADPSLKQDPKFITAWAIATEPTMTPQGMMQPQVPPNWGPQSAAPTQPAASVPQTSGAPAPAFGGVGMGSDIAPIGTMSGAPQTGGFQNINPSTPPQTGPGIIAGTQPFNESQARVNTLTQGAIPDVKRVADGFPALLNLKDQLAGKFGGLGRLMQSPQYKQTYDAMRSAIGDVLYFASGANLNAGELQRKVDAYIPAIGDDAQTAVNKLERFANDVVSMANATKDPQTAAWAQQAVSSIRQTEQQMLAGGNGQKPVVDLGNGITIQEVSP